MSETIFRSSVFYFRTSDSYFLLSDFYFRASETYFRASDFYFRISETIFRPSEFYFRVSEIIFRTSETNFRVSETIFRWSNFYFRAYFFNIRVSFMLNNVQFSFIISYGVCFFDESVFILEKISVKPWMLKRNPTRDDTLNRRKMARQWIFFNKMYISPKYIVLLLFISKTYMSIPTT